MAAVMSVSTRWGTTLEERAMAFPCERYLERFDAAYYRGVTVQARPGVVFRWLCQMRVAPYSYDWIDNLGRRSPRRLIPGLEKLEIGQRFLSLGDRTGFELVEFEYNQHITIRMRPRSIEAKFFGIFASSYLIVPLTPDSCRLLVKVTVRYVRGPLGWFWRVFLPWVDLMMMRRQLLNFKKLSEGMADSAVQPRDQQKE